MRITIRNLYGYRFVLVKHGDSSPYEIRFPKIIERTYE